MVDGHELSVLGTMTGTYAIAQGCLGPGWIKSFIHRHPVMAFSTGLATFGILLPLWVVPIRRALKLPTNQYDADHPDCVFPSYSERNLFDKPPPAKPYSYI